MEDRYYHEYSKMIIKRRWDGKLDVKKATRLMILLGTWWQGGEQTWHG